MLAERLLNEALELQETAYRTKMHVNCAAVHFSLGSLALSCKRHEDAVAHFEEALRVRRSE